MVEYPSFAEVPAFMQWRDRVLCASLISPAVATYIDQVVAMARQDHRYGAYYWHHGCDAFDLSFMLHWYREAGFVSMEDYAGVWREALAVVTTRNNVLLPEQQATIRMALAGGRCPLCSTAVTFCEIDSGVYRAQTACKHLCRSIAVDPEEARSNASSWAGWNWPAATDKHQWQTPEGVRLGPDRLRPHCEGCLYQSLHRHLRTKLRALVELLVRTGRDPRFHERGASPASYLECHSGCSQGDDFCSHMHMEIDFLVDSMLCSMQTSQGIGRELKLVSGGISVHRNGVRGSFNLQLVCYNPSAYPAYAAFASIGQGILRDAGVDRLNVQYAGGKS